MSAPAHDLAGEATTVSPVAAQPDEPRPPVTGRVLLDVAALLVGVALAAAYTDALWAIDAVGALALAPFVLLAPVLLVRDLTTLRLPNAYVLPGAALSLSILLAGGITQGRWMDLACSLGLAASVWLALAALCLGGGMGYGDVKLAGWVSAPIAFIGPMTLMAMWSVSMILPLIVLFVAGLVLRATVGLKKVPFGPVIIVAALHAAALAI